MSSLQELCFQNIASSVERMPPVLQDMVIGTTRQHITDTVRKELIEDVKADVQACAEAKMCDILPFIIPEIMQDIVYAMTHDNAVRKNYFVVYPNIDRYIINTAVKSAENAVNLMERRYVTNSFPHQYFTAYNSNSEDDSEYTSYSDSD